MYIARGEKSAQTVFGPPQPSGMPTFVPIKVVLRGLPPDISLDTLAASLETTFPDVEARPHVVYLEPGRIW
jgi:hypothetical protein